MIMWLAGMVIALLQKQFYYNCGHVGQSFVHLIDYLYRRHIDHQSNGMS